MDYFETSSSEVTGLHRVFNMGFVIIGLIMLVWIVLIVLAVAEALNSP